MRSLRALGIAIGAFVVLLLAAGAAYLLYVVGLWRRAVQATDPFDPAEPI